MIKNPRLFKLGKILLYPMNSPGITQIHLDSLELAFDFLRFDDCWLYFPLFALFSFFPILLRKTLLFIGKSENSSKNFAFSLRSAILQIIKIHRPRYTRRTYEVQFIVHLQTILLRDFLNSFFSFFCRV
jgi:hypothetical protein